MAIDGPLTHGLRMVKHHRALEALLSRGVFQKRGKPGSTNSPTGLKLHEHATLFAQLLLKEDEQGYCELGIANHHQSIHRKAIVEAFPNQFLAALISERYLPRLNRDASDRFWEYLTEQSDELLNLIHYLLPGRNIEVSLKTITNHEYRAGVVCALTALSVSRLDYAGVGDPVDGEITLPPPALWGKGNGDLSWMEAALRENAPQVRANRNNHKNHGSARVTRKSGRWF